jgi:hypothetical protein
MVVCLTESRMASMQQVVHKQPAWATTGHLPMTLHDLQHRLKGHRQRRVCIQAALHLPLRHVPLATIPTTMPILDLSADSPQSEVSKLARLRLMTLEFPSPTPAHLTHLHLVLSILFQRGLFLQSHWPVGHLQPLREIRMHLAEILIVGRISTVEIVTALENIIRPTIEEGRTHTNVRGMLTEALILHLLLQVPEPTITNPQTDIGPTIAALHDHWNLVLIVAILWIMIALVDLFIASLRRGILFLGHLIFVVGMTLALDWNPSDHARLLKWLLLHLCLPRDPGSTKGPHLLRSKGKALVWMLGGAISHQSPHQQNQELQPASRLDQLQPETTLSTKALLHGTSQSLEHPRTWR